MDAESTENKQKDAPERGGREPFDCPHRLAQAFIESRGKLEYLGGRQWRILHQGELVPDESWSIEVELDEFIHAEFEKQESIRKIKVSASLVNRTMKALKSLAAIEGAR